MLAIVPTVVDIGKFAKLLQVLYSVSRQPRGLAPHHETGVNSFERWGTGQESHGKPSSMVPLQPPRTSQVLPQLMKQSVESDAEGSPKWLSSSDFFYQHRARSHPAIIQKYLTCDFIKSAVKSRQVIDAKRQFTNHREEP